MPIDLFMTQLSPTMTEGKIARWLKKEGDELLSGEVIAEVETDKATMEMEVVDEGILHKIIMPEGSVVPVGSVIAVIAEEGEEVPADYQPEQPAAEATPAEAAPAEQAADAAATVSAPVAEAVAGSDADDDEEELQLKPAGEFNPDGEYDVVVIGAGPGGYVAAIRAAQLGLKVACIESTHLGGICLNWGCIPTKALLRTAEVINVIKHSGDALGLGVSEANPDLDKAVARSRSISAKLNKGIGFLFKKNKVEHIEGFASFEPGNKLVVKDTDGASRTVTAKHVVVATGARARAFPGMEIDDEVIITYKQALKPEKLPQKLLIIGSGAIGMEFAYFYNAMGADVTVIEAADQILPLEDHEISKQVARSFKKQKINIITGAMVSSAKNVDGKAVVAYEAKGKSQQLEGDVCLVAVGVIGNTENIGAEHTSMQIERNTIAVDDWYRTDHPGIYAIGDVIGAPALAHVASHEGIVCVEAIAGKAPHKVDYGNVPGCTYCQPQVGSIGLTEQQCKADGIPYKVGRMSYNTNGKAMGLAETDGMVKTIFHAETGELLGAHIVGAEATEMIVSLGVAKTLETTEAELAHHMFPHPTLSEMIHESVLDADDRAIHI